MVIKLLSSNILSGMLDANNRSSKLTDLKVLIPYEKCANAQIFLKIVDKNGFMDIAKLHSSGFYQDDKKHIAYALNLDEPIRVQSGSLLLSLMIFKGEDYLITPPLKVALSVEDFAIAQTTFMARKVSGEVAYYYKEIVDLYNKIKKGEE